MWIGDKTRRLLLVLLMCLTAPAVADAEILDDVLVAAQRTPPRRPRPIAVPPAPAPRTTPIATTRELVDLYVAVGRELAEVARVDPMRTIDLWPRYRWIHVMEAVRDTDKRAVAMTVLSRLRADLRALTPKPRPAQRSAAP